MKGDTAATGATSEKAVPAGVAMRCPRCDSANTKFCYYNNYSLSQPRHFCKTCRRYWTRGGALRNVPVGGGCRKSKKLLKPSTSYSADVIGPGLFSSPAMDFHLSPPTGLLHRPQFPPPWLAAPDLGGAIQQITSTNNNNNNNNTGLTSTIESLSCMNQDLHWKLQQQRLSLLFSKDHHNVNVPEDSSLAPLQEPSSGHDVAAAGWFSGNSYHANHVATAGNGVGTTTMTVSNWNINNGFQAAWSHDNHHFSTA